MYLGRPGGQFCISCICFYRAAVCCSRREQQSSITGGETFPAFEYPLMRSESPSARIQTCKTDISSHRSFVRLLCGTPAVIGRVIQNTPPSNALNSPVLCAQLGSDMCTPFIRSATVLVVIRACSSLRYLLLAAQKLTWNIFDGGAPEYLCDPRETETESSEPRERAARPPHNLYQSMTSQRNETSNPQEVPRVSAKAWIAKSPRRATDDTSICCLFAERSIQRCK